MENLSIECQVAELCRDALAAMANDCNHNVWAACERLKTDLKSIVSETRHTVIDRGVEALRNSVLWANAYSADDATDDRWFFTWRAMSLRGPFVDLKPLTLSLLC